MYTGISEPIRKSRHLSGMEKFGVKIRNWGKPTRQCIVTIVLYCQCTVTADGADRGGGKPELYLGSKKKL